MKKQYGTKDTYDHQPQTINISDCTKPTSYENECVIAQPPKVKMLDNTEDNYNGYEHNYSSTEESALVTDQDNNTSDESVKLKKAKSYLYFVIPENDVEEDKKKEKFQRNRKRQRHTKCPDGTAKFFITIEKAFRHLPKELQLPLKGEMFESMLKYEKLALEDNHSLLGYSTRRTKN